MWDHLTRLIGIQRALTTAHHPQADGQTEIMNQTLEIALLAFINPERNNWSSLLSEFAYSYNTSVHTATKQTPAYLLRGFQPLGKSDLLAGTGAYIPSPASESQSAQDFAEEMEKVRMEAKDALRVAQSYQE